MKIHNNRQCHSKLTAAAMPLEKKIMENKYTLENLGEIQSDINSLIVDYEKESKGPAKMQVLAKEIPKIVKKLMGSANRIRF